MTLCVSVSYIWVEFRKYYLFILITNVFYQIQNRSCRQLMLQTSKFQNFEEQAVRLSITEEEVLHTIVACSFF